MVDEQTSGDGKQHHPHGEGDVPILHGPLTEEERRIAADKEARQAERDIDNEFKKRQLAVSESANRLARRTIWLTVLLAFFTAISAGAAWYQGRMARRSASAASISAQAAKDAVCVASRTLSETQRSNAIQASFAKESLEGTIDSFKKDQRAWLGAGDAKFVIDEKQLVASFVAKNVGKTPAIKVESNIGWAFRPQGQKLQTSDIIYPTKGNLNGTIFPTQSFQITDTLPDPIPASQALFLQDLRSGKTIMYVFTKVEYRDVSMFRIGRITARSLGVTCKRDFPALSTPTQIRI